MIQEKILVRIGSDSAQATISAVFRQAEYRRSLSRTLWQQIVEWIANVWRAIGNTLDTYPDLRWALLLVLLAAAATSIGREVFRRKMDGTGVRHVHDYKGNGSAPDSWTIAQREALAGRYLEAAHALYLAVLYAIARSDRISIDSAKTVGDYSRELRRNSSTSLPLYRQFAKTYEPIVWGAGECDRNRFDELSGIASQIIGISA